MYEYVTLKANNERGIEKLVNQWAEDGWEVVTYAIRPTVAFAILFFAVLTADHVAMIRRPVEFEEEPEEIE
jgi:hypothetical protein